MRLRRLLRLSHAGSVYEVYWCFFETKRSVTRPRGMPNGILVPQRGASELGAS